MIDNMQIKTFLYCTKDKSNKIKKILAELKTYLNYRSGWQNNPKVVLAKLFGDDFKKLELSPLCIDLELRVCDLACPHCFRQTVATPDKIMNKKLALKLIDCRRIKSTFNEFN